MLVGRPPFRDGSEYLTFQRISAGKFDLPESVPPEGASLLRKLLVLRPEDRLGGPGHVFCAGQVQAMACILCWPGASVGMRAGQYSVPLWGTPGEKVHQHIWGGCAASRLRCWGCSQRQG